MNHLRDTRECRRDLYVCGHENSVMIQAPMNLRNVVTIGTYRGGSVGGLEEGKGVQPILGRKNPGAKYKFRGRLYAKSAFRFFTNLPPLNEISNTPL